MITQKKVYIVKLKLSHSIEGNGDSTYDTEEEFSSVEEAKAFLSNLYSESKRKRYIESKGYKGSISDVNPNIFYREITISEKQI